MDIHKAEAAAHQSMGIDERNGFLLSGNAGLRKRAEKGQDSGPVANRPARELPDDEGMTNDFAIVKQRLEMCIPVMEMIYPDRGVDEDHRYAALLRRGTGWRSLSLPPSLASRFALSLAIRYSSPILTSAVFSLTPVSSDALAIRVSSMLIVVLICISMPLLCISVKASNCIYRRRKPLRILTWRT